MSVFSPKSLYIAESCIEGAGRGVFTSVHIAAKVLVEVCPVIIVPELVYPDEAEAGRLTRYLCEFGEETALVLGYGSLYNHSYSPNARYGKIPDKNVIEFRAVRDIQPMQEITVNYNHGNPDDKSPLFMDIPPFN
jgi:SET domain-containing protein